MVTAEEIYNRLTPTVSLNTSLHQKSQRKAHILAAMKEYARLKCEEQRKLCSDNVGCKEERGGLYGEDLYYPIDHDTILNAHEPNFD